MSNSTLDYFETYREKNKELHEARQLLYDLNSSVVSAKSAITELQSEIYAMRKIITMMIDNNLDPVEVKLTTEPSDRKESLWEITDSKESKMSTVFSGVVTAWAPMTATSVTSIAPHTSAITYPTLPSIP